MKIFNKDKIMYNGFSFSLRDGHDTTTALERFEAAYIEHIYKLSRYNQTRTARNLGMSRGGLRIKLKLYFGDKYID